MSAPPPGPPAGGAGVPPAAAPVTMPAVFGGQAVPPAASPAMVGLGAGAGAMGFVGAVPVGGGVFPVASGAAGAAGEGVAERGDGGGGVAAGAGPAPVPPVAAAAAAASAVPVANVPRCAGLEYANMKKEEAREEYKDRRRRELLHQGEIERVKRRKKNDSSMSDDQKYHRRLKMNQDSAAAARAAQDAYVSTLEKLVETAEAEKGMLSLEASNLRQERDELATRLNALHQQVVSALPLVAEAVGGAGAAVDGEQVGGMGDVLDDAPSSALLLRKMMELFDSPEVPSSMTNDAEFARGMLGIMPAPAV